MGSDVAVKRARAQLARVLGEQRADEILAECMAKGGLEGVRSPAELMQLALLLIAQGGIVEVVGRSLKVQALLGGATP